MWGLKVEFVVYVLTLASFFYGITTVMVVA